MEELFTQLLPIALKVGIKVVEYWDLTLDEIVSTIEAYKEQQEDKISMAYLQAQLTASFVGLVFNGKPIPSLQDTFPNMRHEEVDDDQRIAFYKDNFMVFAEEHNKRRRAMEEQDGIRKPSS